MISFLFPGIHELNAIFCFAAMSTKIALKIHESEDSEKEMEMNISKWKKNTQNPPKELFINERNGKRKNQ